METQNNKTPFKALQPFEQKTRLKEILQQAYHRRSRQLPANLDDIVETLRKDLLKAYPDCPIETMDDAIVIETLHNPDTTLSPTFFFNAVKKSWFTPKTNVHNWDANEGLAYWQERKTTLERQWRIGTPEHREACEMVEHYRHGDTEQDTISLLDTCASMLAQMDAHEKEGVKVAKHANVAGVVIPLPAFNPRREFDYLKMRGQVTSETAAAKLPQAIEEVNIVRIADNHNRVKRDEALQDPEVQAMCRRLAVLDWLRSCNTRGVAPSAILAPLVNESQYAQLRRTV